MANAPPIKLSRAPDDSDHVLGPRGAPNALVLYGNFEDSYCRYALKVVGKIRAAIGDRMIYVFRHFPATRLWPHSVLAAQAAEAAGAQGRFFEMHDSLFADQEHLALPDLLARARALGLDERRMADDIRRGTHLIPIRGNRAEAKAMGMLGTPSIFWNGIHVSGQFVPEKFIDPVLTGTPDPSTH